MKDERWEETGNHVRMVAVVGLGYVGLPLALLFAKKGFTVLGIDSDAGKIGMLQKGVSYIHEIKHDEVKEAISASRLLPSGQMSSIQAAEAVILCVPTPLTPHGMPDLSYLVNAAKGVSPYLRTGQLVVLESSTYPGTTREELLPLLAKTGLAIGSELMVAYSPERVDPGNKSFPLEAIPKVVSGVNAESTERAANLYGSIFPSVHPVSSTDAAEMTKILENAYRLVNISFMNEMAIICEKLGLDLWEVVDAAASKPFGFQPFYPGPGIGGHCIPVDPFYLQYRIKQFGMRSEFIGISHAVNHGMPHYIVQRLKRELAPASLADANILIYGVAYKPDIADYRESASIDLIQLLRLEGANVYYHDPYIPVLHLGDAELRSVPLQPAFLEGMSAVVIATHHSGLPVETLLAHSALLYDTRNVVGSAKGKAKVITLGNGKKTEQTGQTGQKWDGENRDNAESEPSPTPSPSRSLKPAPDEKRKAARKNKANESKDGRTEEGSAP